MEGAMFMDVGNIWSVKDNRPGTEFTAGSFIKELAVCSGIGLRYDFTYVILRLDLGIKLHDPALSEGKRWISPGDYLQKGNQNLVFAIGYPF
jgi:outer membrane protein assembly factor BamA